MQRPITMETAKVCNVRLNGMRPCEPGEKRDIMVPLLGSTENLFQFYAFQNWLEY